MNRVTAVAVLIAAVVSPAMAETWIATYEEANQVGMAALTDSRKGCEGTGGHLVLDAYFNEGCYTRSGGRVTIRWKDRSHWDWKEKTFSESEVEKRPQFTHWPE